MTEHDLIHHAQNVFTIEANAILALGDRLGKNFLTSIDLLYACQGKVIVTGMGKSGQIARKIAATLASTGTPAFFMHPGEGVHGDLGMLAKQDIVLALSFSGETEEINHLVPVIKRLGISLISMLGKPQSTLAKHADVVLDVSVAQEACPLGLAPTASTAASLAMGDAIAMALLEKRGFKQEDFAQLHPGGSLGKRFFLKVQDLMHTGDAVPLIKQDMMVKECINEITSKRLGAVGVLNDHQELVGVITDGDLRRAMESRNDLLSLKAGDIMNSAPKVVAEDRLAAHALHIMEKHAIMQLFVCPADKTKRCAGILHLHDLIKAGIADVR